MKSKRGVSIEDMSLSIDLNNLDTECVGQPDRFFQVAKAQARAKARLAEADANLDLVKARVRQSIQKKLERGITDKKRVTESTINAEVIRSDEFIEARQALAATQLQYDDLTAMVKAFEHRKDQLRNLVLLHGQHYFSDAGLGEDDSVSHKKVTAERVRRRLNNNEDTGE